MSSEGSISESLAPDPLVEATNPETTQDAPPPKAVEGGKSVVEEIEKDLRMKVPHLGFHTVYTNDQLNEIDTVHAIRIKTHRSEARKNPMSSDAKKLLELQLNPLVDSWIDWCSYQTSRPTIGTAFLALPFNPLSDELDGHFTDFCQRTDREAAKTLPDPHMLGHFLHWYGHLHKYVLKTAQAELLAGKASEPKKGELDVDKLLEDLKDWKGPWCYQHPVGKPVGSEVPEGYQHTVDYDYFFQPQSRYCRENKCPLEFGTVSNNNIRRSLVEFHRVLWAGGWTCIRKRAIELLSSANSPVWAPAMTGEQREEKKAGDIPDEIMFKLWKDAFGRMMINEDGKLGTTGDFGRPAAGSPGYHKALLSAHTHFKSVLKHNNEETLKKLRDLDTAAKKLQELNRYRVDFPTQRPDRTDLLLKIEIVKKVSAGLESHKACGFTWWDDFRLWYWEQIDYYDGRLPTTTQIGHSQDASQDSSAPQRGPPASNQPASLPPDRPSALSQDESERATQHSSLREPAVQAVGSIPLLPAKWDIWDLLNFLGLLNKEDHLQRDIERSSRRYSREEIHNYTLVGGQPVFTHVDEHDARERCLWPLLSTPVCAIELPPQLKWHQIYAIALYLALGFSADPKLNRMASFMLADDTGLGKTWTMAALISILTHYHQKRLEDPTWIAPVMASWKPDIFTDMFAESVHEVVHPPVFHPWSSLGVANRPLEPVIIATKSSIRAQFAKELRHLLDPGYFTIHDSDLIRSDPKEFFTSMDHKRQAAVAERKHLVVDVIVVHHYLLANAWTLKAKHGIFGRGRKYSMFFFDEAHEARNPTRNLFRAARALSEITHLRWAATATPVINSPLDLLSVLRSIGFSTHERPTLPMPSLPAELAISLSKASSAYKGYDGCHFWYKQLCRIYYALNLERQKLQAEAAELRRNSGIDYTFASTQSATQQGEHEAIVFDLRGNDLDHSRIIELPHGAEADDLRARFQAVSAAIVDRVFKPIRQLVGPVLLRRLRSHHAPYLDLPIVTSKGLKETTVEVEIDDCQRSTIKTITGPNRDSQIASGFEIKMRQALIDPHFAIYGVSNFVDPVPPKLAALARALDDRRAENEAQFGNNIDLYPKGVIYTHWASMAPNIALMLRHLGHPVSILTGSMSRKARDKAVSEFCAEGAHMSTPLAGPSPQPTVNGGRTHDVEIYEAVPCTLMVITDASDAGLNLQAADRVYALDIPWSHSQRHQIIGRVFRIGQDKDVEVITFVARRTLDQFIQLRQHDKFLITSSLDESVSANAPTQPSQRADAVFTEVDPCAGEESGPRRRGGQTYVSASAVEEDEDRDVGEGGEEKDVESSESATGNFSAALNIFQQMMSSPMFQRFYPAQLCDQRDAAAMEAWYKDHHPMDDYDLGDQLATVCQHLSRLLELRLMEPELPHSDSKEIRCDAIETFVRIRGQDGQAEIRNWYRHCRRIDNHNRRRDVYFRVIYLGDIPPQMLGLVVSNLEREASSSRRLFTAHGWPVPCPRSEYAPIDTWPNDPADHVIRPEDLERFMEWFETSGRPAPAQKRRQIASYQVDEIEPYVPDPCREFLSEAYWQPGVLSDRSVEDGTDPYPHFGLPLGYHERHFEQGNDSGHEGDGMDGSEDDNAAGSRASSDDERDSDEESSKSEVEDPSVDRRHRKRRRTTLGSHVSASIPSRSATYINTSPPSQDAGASSE